jgi:ATP-dependent 26S proteasome regulatory subunit
MTKKNYTKFRTHTDLNNYNNFLLDLDEKIKKKEKDQQLTTKSDINKLIENTNNKYNSCIQTPNVTGLTSWEILLSIIEKELDPNLYITENPIKNSNIIMDKTKNEEKTIIKKTKLNIEPIEIKHIQDLLDLIKKYPLDPFIEYNINIEALHNIKDPLEELNSMIGILSLKENIVDQILFYIQNLHSLNSKGNDFMHTVIYGPPGTGKTEIAKIIGTIFSKLGILKKGTFKKVTRADLVAGYLGQTALKTRDVIKDSLGGVLFIDEAYSLGNEEKRDSFSKECIDTLCESLSDHKENLMVIIAGYEKDLTECFFSYNQGLNSRFTWRFKTDDYTAEDLLKIFIKKVNDSGWKIQDEKDTKINIKWFETNKKHFKFYGRDIETLFAKTKIAHSRRVFCLDKSVKKNITVEDINKGLKIFLENTTSKKNDEEDRLKQILSSMYT